MSKTKQLELLPAPGKIKKTPEPSYEITDHCCLLCMGRLLKRRLLSRKPSWEVVCAKCENKTIITDGTLPCFCHRTVNIYGKMFECVKNPNKSDELPNVILVRERAVENKPPEIRPSRFVGIENYHTYA